jgi:hypothetical protein
MTLTFGSNTPPLPRKAVDPLDLPVSVREAAKILGTSVSFLNADRIGAKRVPFFRMGRKVLYVPRAIMAYRDTLMQGPEISASAATPCNTKQ